MSYEGPLINLLLADDHKVLLDGLSVLLSKESGIKIVAKCNNGQSVLKTLETHSVDVVLMDIDMPVLNGMEATKSIKSLKKDIKVIGLSSHNKLSFVKTMLNNGASGYLLKTCDANEIIEAIYTVANGEQYISSALRHELLNNMLDSKKQKSSVPMVTRREKEVLQLIANELTNSEIAKELSISVNTVEFHRKNLLLKFDAKNSVGLVRSAMLYGLI